MKTEIERFYEAQAREFYSFRETPAQQQARLASADIDERALSLARQVEDLFAKGHKGGVAQRRARLQVLIRDAIEAETKPKVRKRPSAADPRPVLFGWQGHSIRCKADLDATGDNAARVCRHLCESPEDMEAMGENALRLLAEWRRADEIRASLNQVREGLASFGRIWGEATR